MNASLWTIDKLSILCVEYSFFITTKNYILFFLASVVVDLFAMVEINSSLPEPQSHKARLRIFGDDIIRSAPFRRIALPLGNAFRVKMSCMEKNLKKMALSIATKNYH